MASVALVNEPARPIDSCLDHWHDWLRGDLPGGLESLLHEDCVFYSPIVFTPQRGREVTALYLAAAAGTLTGESGAGESGDQASDGGASDAGRFRYVKDVRGDTDAVLEFETSVGDKYVNGVDIITCDEDAMITEFRVMIRPLQAVNLVHEQMRAMLEKMRA